MHFSTQCILLSSLTYIYGLPGNVPSRDYDDPRQPRVPQGNTTTPPREPASNANGTATHEDQSIGSARNGGVAPPLQSVGWAGFGGRPHATTEITSSTRGSTPGGHGRQAGGSSPNSKRSSSSGKDPAVKRTKNNADELTGNTRNQAGPSTRNITQTSSTPSASNEHEHQGKPKPNQKYVDGIIAVVIAKVQDAPTDSFPFYPLQSPSFQGKIPKRGNQTWEFYTETTVGNIVREACKSESLRDKQIQTDFKSLKFHSYIPYRPDNYENWDFCPKLLWTVMYENDTQNADPKTSTYYEKPWTSYARKFKVTNEEGLTSNTRGQAGSSARNVSSPASSASASNRHEHPAGGTSGDDFATNWSVLVHQIVTEIERRHPIYVHALPQVKVPQRKDGNREWTDGEWEEYTKILGNIAVEAYKMVDVETKAKFDFATFPDQPKDFRTWEGVKKLLWVVMQMHYSAKNWEWSKYVREFRA